MPKRKLLMDYRTSTSMQVLVISSSWGWLCVCTWVHDKVGVCVVGWGVRCEG